MATAILSTSKRNQVLSDIGRGLTPFQKLLKYMPEVAATLLNQYINKGASDFEVNFSLLEEQRGTISGHCLHLGNTDVNLQEDYNVASLERSILRDWPQGRDGNSSAAIFDKDGNRKQPKDKMEMDQRFQILVDGQKFYLEPECRGFRQYWPECKLQEFIQRKNHHPLKLLMDSHTDELIQHPVTMSCIMHHWDLYSPSYYFSTFVMLLYSVVLAINVTGQAWKKTYESEYGLPLDVVILCTMVLCCLAAGLGIFRELIQCVENGLGYITWGNFFDLASYVMTLMAVLPWTWTWQYKHLLGAFAVLITCLNTLFYMRALPLFGIFICMLRNTLMTLLGYFPGLLALVLIFAVCFQIVMLKLVAFDNYLTSAVSIYVMLTGELDYSDRYLPSEDADPSLPSEPERHAGMVLLVVAITVMSIIVANLLIGLAVCDVRDLTRNAEKHALIIKGKMILDDLFNIMFRWIRQCDPRPKRKGESSTLTIPLQHNCKRTKANRLLHWCQTKIRHPLTKKSIGEKISKLPSHSSQAGTEEVTTSETELTKRTSNEQKPPQEPSKEPKEAATPDMQLFAPHGGEVFRKKKWHKLRQTDSLDSMLTLLYIEYKQNIEFSELVRALHGDDADDDDDDDDDADDDGGDDDGGVDDDAKALMEVLDRITGSIGSWTAARLLWMKKVHPLKRTEDLPEEEAIFKPVIKSVLGRFTTDSTSWVANTCSRCSVIPASQLDTAGVIEAMLKDNIKGRNACQVDLQSVLNGSERKVKCQREVTKKDRKAVCSGTISYTFQISHSPMLLCVHLGGVKIRNKYGIKRRNLQSSIVLSRPTGDQDQNGRTNKERFARYDLVMVTILSEQPRRYWSMIKVGDSWWRHDPKLLMQKEGCRAKRIPPLEEMMQPEEEKSSINYVVYRKDVSWLPVTEQ